MEGVQVWKPWGYYVDIHRPSDKKIVVKEIVVDPDGQLSNQFHKKRTEFWYIVSGEGVVTVENFDIYVNDGDHLLTQLNSWGCKFHGLMCGDQKPHFDLVIDDKAKRIEEI